MPSVVAAVFDYHVTFDEEDTSVAGPARWGDLPVVHGDEMWTVPVDDVEPRGPCGGPLPVLDTIDMERVYLFEGKPHAEATVTPTVVVELIPRNGQWRLHGFASSDVGLSFASEEMLWERDGSDTSEREEMSV